MFSFLKLWEALTNSMPRKQQPVVAQNCAVGIYVPFCLENIQKTFCPTHLCVNRKYIYRCVYICIPAYADVYVCIQMHINTPIWKICSYTWKTRHLNTSLNPQSKIRMVYSRYHKKKGMSVRLSWMKGVPFQNLSECFPCAPFNRNQSLSNITLHTAARKKWEDSWV